MKAWLAAASFAAALAAGVPLLVWPVSIGSGGARGTPQLRSLHLGGFSLVAVSIGLFYVPAVIAMLLAAAAPSHRAPTAGTPVGRSGPGRAARAGTGAGRTTS